MVDPIRGQKPIQLPTPTTPVSPPTAANPAHEADATTISAAARSTQMGADAVDISTEIRSEMIFTLRAAITGGTYEVDASEIAERLIDHL